MKDLKGTKTEAADLMEAFGESMATNSILIMHLKLRKMVMFK